MPKTKTKAETPEVKDEPKRVYYTNSQARNIAARTLRTAKVSYVSITVETDEIEIVQAGDHDSAGAIMSLLTQPGIYGPSETPPVVQQDKDQFDVVTRTVLTLSRDGAEPMFDGDGVNDGDEGTEVAPDPKPSKTTKANVVEAPIAGTPEAVDQYTEAELDDVLEGHGIEAGTFDSVEAKVEAVKKIVFIG